MIPILHKALQMSNERIKKNETRLEEVVKSAIAAQKEIEYLKNQLYK